MRYKTPKLEVVIEGEKFFLLNDTKSNVPLVYFYKLLDKKGKDYHFDTRESSIQARDFLIKDEDSALFDLNRVKQIIELKKKSELNIKLNFTNGNSVIANCFDI